MPNHVDRVSEEPTVCFAVRHVHGAGASWPSPADR